jgi:hypothetical protein
MLEMTQRDRDKKIEDKGIFNIGGERETRAAIVSQAVATES